MCNLICKWRVVHTFIKWLCLHVTCTLLQYLHHMSFNVLGEPGFCAALATRGQQEASCIPSSRHSATCHMYIAEISLSHEFQCTQGAALLGSPGNSRPAGGLLHTFIMWFCSHVTCTLVKYLPHVSFNVPRKSGFCAAPATQGQQEGSCIPSSLCISSWMLKKKSCCSGKLLKDFLVYLYLSSTQNFLKVTSWVVTWLCLCVQ